MSRDKQGTHVYEVRFNAPVVLNGNIHSVCVGSVYKMRIPYEIEGLLEISRSGETWFVPFSNILSMKITKPTA